MQSPHKDPLLLDAYAHVRNNGLDLSSSLHPVQPFLRDGACKQVEDFYFGINSSPLTHLKKFHLVRVVPLPVMISSCNCAENCLAMEINHLSSSDNLAKLVRASWRRKTEGGRSCF